MNYSEALIYIDSICGLGSKLDLSRISEILARLGNPQEKYKIIHVAGTNGKGSACSMLSQILISAGYKTAEYTSPHLERYNERFVINNKEISNDDYAKYMGIIKKNADEMEEEGFGRPTVFEHLTALGFLYFADNHVDFAVIEVGLGGRFDATNVVKAPILSVIASISFDHTEYLGNTLESIAFEKGGIIKQGCPVVLYNQSECVYNVIKKLSDERNSKLYYAFDEKIDVIRQNIDETILSVKNEYFEYNDVLLPLIGEYQIKNCTLVLLAAYALKQSGIPITDKNIRDGIFKAKWNGRMEVCRKNPLIVLDGAHNPDGILMLAKSAEKYFAGKKLVLLMGVLSDKEYGKMAEEIIPLADAVVITRPDSERALSADGLKKVALKYCDRVYSLENIDEAYEFAIGLVDKEDVLLCAGSLYLVGRLRTLIMGGN
ncbi:MAG: folylpolyglutamate synthase/dihydrofolate synthase family protein [Candidatus Metalachnospira sp.]|nr:folylpolyglutamate synthase/dihydrofolate synthase family protein [Candidatus Metalachnospira sp.]